MDHLLFLFLFLFHFFVVVYLNRFQNEVEAKKSSSDKGKAVARDTFRADAKYE